MGELTTASHVTRLSLPAVLDDLSMLADTRGPRRPSNSLLRATIQEALRDGTYVAPRLLLMPSSFAERP
jgi:hypothetical protein